MEELKIELKLKLNRATRLLLCVLAVLFGIAGGVVLSAWIFLLCDALFGL
jgi:hypothetical protein